jgi:hypothetical protein
LTRAPESSRRACSFASGLVVVLCSALWPNLGRANQSARLDADALLSGKPYEGLLVLHGGYDPGGVVDAEALVWLGASDTGSEGDVLVISVRLREPNGWGEARVGRFILATGAVRPVQIDGVTALARAPSGSSLELFAGMPVVPELGARAFDWLAGARAAQWLFAQRVGAGVSYLQRRDAGPLDDQELGADLSVVPLPWLTLGAVGAYDLVYDGLAEARADAVARDGGDRIELFGARRVADRLLPATSLFSVLGDGASSELGSDALWNAFPRLDLGATLAVEALASELGYRAALRSTLRLSDQDGGQVQLEGMRRELRDDGWTGGSLAAQWPITRQLNVHASLELVFADHPRGRGAVWPWARAGASYDFAEQWQLAAALGVRASPRYEHEVQGLVRLTYRSEGLLP